MHSSFNISNAVIFAVLKKTFLYTSQLDFNFLYALMVKLAHNAASYKLRYKLLNKTFSQLVSKNKNAWIIRVCYNDKNIFLISRRI